MEHAWVVTLSPDAGGDAGGGRRRRRVVGWDPTSGLSAPYPVSARLT